MGSQALASGEPNRRRQCYPPWVDDENSKPAVQGLRRFYDLVTAEPIVSITALQTVGIYGHDGFAIAVVTADP